MHASIWKINDLPTIRRCSTCCSNYHCPQCPVTKFKTASFARARIHETVHLRNGIFFNEFIINKCKLDCRKEGHHHCPICSMTFVRRDVFVSHLLSCKSTSSASSSALSSVPEPNVSTVQSSDDTTETPIPPFKIVAPVDPKQIQSLSLKAQPRVNTHPNNSESFPFAALKTEPGASEYVHVIPFKMEPEDSEQFEFPSIKVASEDSKQNKVAQIKTEPEKTIQLKPLEVEPEHFELFPLCSIKTEPVKCQEILTKPIKMEPEDSKQFRSLPIKRKLQGSERISGTPNKSKPEIPGESQLFPVPQSPDKTSPESLSEDIVPPPASIVILCSYSKAFCNLTL
ncbi:uncharacterized protein LOC114797941 [Denticeps clupeoides]|uniref:Uncharacterized protein n=1 Tax=Denticeps clupeoides TaxID=299321 RepID=A0AAY4BA27_9TELE|nr:uncharacterized protein LOC114797941 [Denticeps clupeoides]